MGDILINLLVEFYGGTINAIENNSWVPSVTVHLKETIKLRIVVVQFDWLLVIVWGGILPPNNNEILICG